ncbi:MAG TPA: M15 family metallopeptidase [Vicinamibacterales bacterium]|nr:M15 family metallopeptidase [Vicinamibacterales bacterium]
MTMRYVRGFGGVTAAERRRADRFYDALMGVRTSVRPPFGRAGASDETDEQAPPIEQPDQQPPVLPQAPVQPAVQRPYLPAGGRNFVPRQGVFTCRPASFVVVPASFLPERTTNAGAAIDAALTAAGLSAAQRGQITRPGLDAIAAEFGGAALTELFARLRWSAADIVASGHGADSKLVPRLLIHIPGHFRELARRAPDAREAFVLECLGWLLMAHIRGAVASATGSSWWVPPSPPFVTAVPNPIPPISPEVSRLCLRYLLIDTTLTAAQWNGRLMAWGGGLAGRQWQAEINAPDPGRPFYASLAAIPAHLNTDAPRAAFLTAWNQRLADTDAAHPPDAAAAATVTLEGLRNAVALRTCDNANAHLPRGALADLGLQGLEFTYVFPRTRGITLTKLALMSQLHPVYTALFRTIYELGWNDLLYHCEGGGCFRGTKHPAAARVQIAGVAVTVDPFAAPNATTVTRVNTNFSATQRARVVRAERTARSISEHGNGSANDFNVAENDQGIAARPFGSMDPRVVAIFEAFHFRWGACFSPTDPMHFDYSHAPSAPAAANAGALGQVVTPRLLLPARATTAQEPAIA